MSDDPPNDPQAAQSDKPDRLKPFCSRCGSTAILKDAFASWDVEAQDWVLSAVFDYTICDECGEETRIEWRNPDATAKASTVAP